MWLLSITRAIRKVCARVVQIGSTSIYGIGSFLSGVWDSQGSLAHWFVIARRKKVLMSRVYVTYYLCFYRTTTRASLGSAQRNYKMSQSPNAFRVDVMSLVVSGVLNKQIAAELDASEATVKMHRSQAMKKMHAKSLPELVRMGDKLKSIR